MRIPNFSALGLGVALLLPGVGQGQMVRRSAPPQRMGGEVRVPSIVRESSLPPIRMGSLQPYNASAIGYDGYSYPGYDGYSYRCSYCIGRPVSYGYDTYAPYIAGNWYNFVYVPIRSTYVGWSRIVRSHGPVYTTYWAPVPVRIWTATSQGNTAPVDPARSGISSITRADSASGGGVMRIETVSDSVARVTWLGTTRPIREARVFLADSVQQSLRGALVDQQTPSALLKFAELAPRVAYVGLTITYANGLIESTLVPWRIGVRP